MMQKVTGFWRGFTIWRMVVVAIMFFVGAFLFEAVTTSNNWHQIFTAGKVARRSFEAIFFGFFISLWHEPREVKHSKN